MLRECAAVQESSSSYRSRNSARTYAHRLIALLIVATGAWCGRERRHRLRVMQHMSVMLRHSARQKVSKPAIIQRKMHLSLF